MGLKVWLPLDGNIENKGSSNATVTNYGATVSTAGKTGSCYSFDGTDDYMQFSDLDIGSESKLSIAFWCNPTGSDLTGIFTVRKNSIHQISLYSTNLYFRDSNHSSLTSFQFEQPTSGVWTHYAIIYDNGSWIIYKNGLEIKRQTYSSGSLNDGLTEIRIGRYQSSSGNAYYGGLLNDFRIYDHALSTKEVKELSQALILHYPLDGGSIGNPNMVLDSYYTISPWTRANLGTEEYKGKTAIKVRVNYLYQDSASNTPARNIFPLMTFKENTQYTLSVDWCDHIRTDGNSTKMYLRFWYSDDTYSQIISPTAGNDSDWTHRKLTSTAGKTVIGITTTYSFAGTVSIANLKIEEGTIETPCSDGIDYAKVHDDSGYRRDGNINGTPSLMSDTPRYQASTSFNGISYIQVESPSTEVRTITFWAKWNSIPSGQSVVFVDQKSKIGFGIMSTGLLCSTNGVSTKTFPKTGIVANQWYHFAIVNTGSTPTATTRGLYINGMEQTPTSSTTNWTFTLDYLQIGKRSTTSGGFAGKLSDFRMYSTALSASDILDLYNAPVYIDNLGTMGAFEFIENSEIGQSIKKTGVVGVKNLIEPSDNLILMPDGSVFLRLLRHNNPASKIFTKYNCWLNSSDTDLYSSLILLKNADWMKNLSEYEFLAFEKLTSSGTEAQVRWKQTSNPATTSSATGFQLVSGTAQYLTAGLANAGTHGCFDVDDANKWWCCCGCYEAYQGGIPGFNGVITTGYIELFVKIPEEIIKGYTSGDTKFFNQSIISNKFKEI